MLALADPPSPVGTPAEVCQGVRTSRAGWWAGPSASIGRTCGALHPDPVQRMPRLSETVAIAARADEARPGLRDPAPGASTAAAEAIVTTSQAPASKAAVASPTASASTSTSGSATAGTGSAAPAACAPQPARPPVRPPMIPIDRPRPAVAELAAFKPLCSAFLSWIKSILCIGSMK